MKAGRRRARRAGKDTRAMSGGDVKAPVDSPREVVVHAT